MKANYEEDKVIVSAIEPVGVNRKKVWFKKGKNLSNINSFDSVNTLQNIFIIKSKVVANSDIVISLTKSRISNTTITNNIIYGISKIHLYNKSNVLLNTIIGKTFSNFTSGSINAEEKITIPADCDYIIVDCSNNNGDSNYNTSVTDIMIEQNTVKTTYEAYIEPEIYILNSNSVYERFYGKSELNKEHYSTGEQKIGTWIDGKNLYRKTIFKTAKITANTNLVINSEIQNIDTITKIDGVISSSLKNNYRQINTYNLENNAVSISMSASTNGNITIYSTDDWSTPNIIITLEYTKTTD